MPNYPHPNENPFCKCKDNPMAAMFCSYGHMMECHYPYSCKNAGCGHLYKYDFSQAEIESAIKQAVERIRAGMIPEYYLGENDEFAYAVGTEPRSNFVMHDLLSIIDLHVPIEKINEWSASEYREVFDWAVLSFYHANDNDVKVTETPGIIKPFLKTGK